MAERRRIEERDDSNILGEVVIEDKGGVLTVRDWERFPTSYFAKPVEGYTGREYIQDRRVVKPVVIVTVIDN